MLVLIGGLDADLSLVKPWFLWMTKGVFHLGTPPDHQAPKGTAQVLGWRFFPFHKGPHACTPEIAAKAPRIPVSVSKNKLDSVLNMIGFPLASECRDLGVDQYSVRPNISMTVTPSKGPPFVCS